MGKITTLKTYYITTDGKEFPTSGYYSSDGADKMAIKHEKTLWAKMNSDQAWKQIKRGASYSASDGKIFSGEYEKVLREVQAHQAVVDIQEQGQILANILYQGDLTQSEYARHLTSNMHKIKKLFVMH